MTAGGNQTPGASVPSEDDPVEAHLDQALVCLPGTPRQIRHALAELEAHLLDAVAAGVRDGLDESAARAEAVRRFGPVAGAIEAPALGLRLTAGLRRRLALAALLLTAVAGIAVGLAGVVAAAVRALWGANAIATPFPAGAHSPSDCARWRAGYPAARDCITAMTLDHADDFLRNTAIGGLLGLVAAVLFWRLRARWVSAAVASAMPRAAEELIGALSALGLAVILVGQGVDAVVVTRGDGAGQALSLAGPALLAAGFLGVRAARRLRLPLPVRAW